MEAVLDIAAGTGVILFLLATAFRGHRAIPNRSP